MLWFHAAVLSVADASKLASFSHFSYLQLSLSVSLRMMLVFLVVGVLVLALLSLSAPFQMCGQVSIT